MTVNVRTTINPAQIITVSDAEYLDLDRQGLIYSVEGTDPQNGPAHSPRRLALANSMRERRALNVAYPALFSPAPTVTFAQTGSTVGTNVSRVKSAQAITHIGIVPRYNVTYFSMGSWCQARGTAGESVAIRADTVEFLYRAAAGGGTYWVWIDDQPVTAAPVAWTGSVNATQRITVDFPAVESHRIEIRTDLLELQAVAVAAGESLQAAPRRPYKEMAVGDSLTDGSGEAIPQLTWPSHVGRMLGNVELIGNAVGGSGYSAGPTPYTHVDRLVALQDPSIDFYHLKGSVNDNPVAAATLRAAITLVLETIRGYNPDALVLMSGPDPTGAAASVAADVRANADIVRELAVEYSDVNVIGWVDPLMTRGVVGAWSGGMNLTAGQRVTHQGGVYETTQATTTGAFNTIDFARISPFYGTGRVGTTAGNGNRDVFILSDDVHWSLAAHHYMGQYFVDRYAEAFDAFVRGEFYLYE